MKPNSEVVKKLVQSLDYIEIISDSPPRNGRYTFIRSNIDEKTKIGIKKEGLNLIHQCVDDILDTNFKTFGPLYSYLNEKFVFEFLIGKILKTKENADPNKYNLIYSALQEFLNKLVVTTFLCYGKIGNLKVSKIHDFSSFKIYPNNKEIFEQLWNDSKEMTETVLEHFQEDREIYQSIIEIKVFAIDSNQAIEKTQHELTDILNVFKIFGAKGIFSEGCIDAQFDDVTAINQDTHTITRIAGVRNPGRLGPPFDLDEFDSENKKFTAKLSKIFNKETSSSFDKKILNSLIWLGDSIYEPNLSHRLLKMIISMESLLLDSDDRGTKIHLLEERAAFLLGQNYETRTLIADTIKQAYQLRNDIVHNGEKKPIPLRLIKRLFLFNYDLSLKLLTSDQFSSIKDLKNEVKFRKYKNELETKESG